MGHYAVGQYAYLDVWTVQRKESTPMQNIYANDLAVRVTPNECLFGYRFDGPDSTDETTWVAAPHYAFSELISEADAALRRLGIGMADRTPAPLVEVLEAVLAAVAGIQEPSPDLCKAVEDAVNALETREMHGWQRSATAKQRLLDEDEDEADRSLPSASPLLAALRDRDPERVGQALAALPRPALDDVGGLAIATAQFARLRVEISEHPKDYDPARIARAFLTSSLAASEDMLAAAEVEADRRERAAETSALADRLVDALNERGTLRTDELRALLGCDAVQIARAIAVLKEAQRIVPAPDQPDGGGAWAPKS